MNEVINEAVNVIEFKSYLSIDFLIYVGRWIFSAFVMMIPLYFLQKFQISKYFKKIKGYKTEYQEYIDLIIIQIIGAFIFWYIDQMIFKGV